MKSRYKIIIIIGISVTVLSVLVFANLQSNYSNTIEIKESASQTLEEFEGIIIDKRLGPLHSYHFFTNDPFKTFNTGSTGIKLEGLNTIDELHGKHAKLFGIRTDKDLGIEIYKLQILDSLIPQGNALDKSVREVSLDELTKNPDKYYNQMIKISGELQEYENSLAYAGVGCDTAKYTTSDEFVPDFPSSRHLHVGEKKIGVRIGTHDDLGKADPLLTPELKTQVEIEGIFVPNLVDSGQCEHIIHKSGYLLTELDNIMPNPIFQKCANLFDDIIEFQKDALVQCELDGNICELRPLEDVLAEAPISQEFRDNNCSLSVEGWVHLSENEDLIWSSEINWEKTIRLSNIFLMKPDSSEFFYYPNSDDTENRDAYETFMLIRLPEWLGGNVDDVTAFRVYSALSVDDHCLVKYFHGERRQQIMNPCSGVIYRAIDGTMIMPFARVPGGQPIALPHLELSTDENGFLYIEPPVWSKTKNGVIGYGREITNSEIEQGSMFLINSFAKAHPDYSGIPPEFAGMTLADIVQEDDERFKILYSEFTPLAQHIEIHVTKCDCEELKAPHTYEEIKTVGNITLAIHGIKSGGDDTPERINEYHIRFAKNGFEYEIVGKNLDYMMNSITAKLEK